VAAEFRFLQRQIFGHAGTFAFGNIRQLAALVHFEPEGVQT